MCVRVPVCAYENACVCACEPDFCFVTIVSFRCHNRLQILVDSSFICIYPSLYVWLCVRACACVRMRLSVYVRGQYNVQFKYVTFKIVVHPFEILALKKNQKNYKYQKIPTKATNSHPTLTSLSLYSVYICMYFHCMCVLTALPPQHNVYFSNSNLNFNFKLNFTFNFDLNLYLNLNLSNCIF